MSALVFSSIRVCFAGAAVVVVILLGTGMAFGADPVIHVAWGEYPPPIEGTHYVISTESPASVEFPNVELVQGSLTWKIWSTDTDNPSAIGDIGVITSPYAENFAVRIEDDQAGPGARHVKGIVLDPTGSTNYSNIAASQMTGDLEDEVFLQRYEGGAVGGAVDLEIGGDVLGAMNLPWVQHLVVGGDDVGVNKVIS